MSSIQSIKAGLKVFILVSLLALNSLALAEDKTAAELQLLKSELLKLQQSLSALNQLVSVQQQKIEQLNIQQSVAESGTAATAVEISQASSPAASGNARPSGLFIPDIGVLADIVGTASETLPDDEGNNRVSVREVEVIIGSDIDPYSRLDSTISLSDFEETEIEEAYISYWDLPAESKGRIGRYHQPIGKAAALHRDSLDTVDEPLVVSSYLGEHGIHQSGFDIGAFTPVSSDSYTQHLSLGLMEGGNGHGGTLFGPSTDKPVIWGHLSNFWSLSDANNLELGVSYLIGSNQEDKSLDVNVLGLDATYIHLLPSQKRFKLQSEIFIQTRSDSKTHEENILKQSPHEDEDEHSTEQVFYDSDSYGLYALADYRFSQSWGLGTRYDYVQQIEFDEDSLSNEEWAASAYLTFHQSEFARWRMQYQYANLADGENDNRFFLQGTFAIGTHKHALN